MGRNFVLTAHHCVPDREQFWCTRHNSNERTEEWHDRVGTFIYLGTLRADGQNYTQVHSITDYALHNDYRWARLGEENYMERNNDIALVRTAQPIRFHATTVAPAVLGNRQSRSRTGWQCRISGWGQLRLGQDSEVLRHSWNEIKSPIACETISRRRYEIDTEICTEGKYKVRRAFVPNHEGEPDVNANMILDWVAPSSSSGDSGGPLSCLSGERHTYRAQHMSVYGVVSYGDDFEGRLNLYSYFTRVASHVDWIRQQFQQFNEERRGQEGHIDEELLLDGRHAAMGQFPYQVVVGRQGAHRFCSGAIIDKRWVVSAAGCFRPNSKVIAGLVNLLVDDNEALQRRTCEAIVRRGNLELCKTDRKFTFRGRFVKKIKFARTQEIEVVPEECVASSWELKNNRLSNHLTYKEANYHWPHDPLDVEEINRFDPGARTGHGAPLVCTTVEETISDDDERYYTDDKNWDTKSDGDKNDDDKNDDDKNVGDKNDDDKNDEDKNYDDESVGDKNDSDESFYTVINDSADSVEQSFDSDESDYDENDDEENDDKYRHLYGINVAILRNGDWRGSYVNVRRHSRWIQQTIGRPLGTRRMKPMKNSDK